MVWWWKRCPCRILLVSVTCHCNMSSLVYRFCLTICSSTTVLRLQWHEFTYTVRAYVTHDWDMIQIFPCRLWHCTLVWEIDMWCSTLPELMWLHVDLWISIGWGPTKTFMGLTRVSVLVLKLANEVCVSPSWGVPKHTGPNGEDMYGYLTVSGRAFMCLWGED